MPERITWTKAAWEDYLNWQMQDRKTFRRINLLLQDSVRTPFSGIGKPEQLRENLSGFWPRRIDVANRLVYTVDENDLVIMHVVTITNET